MVDDIDRRQTTRKLRVFDLCDGDTKIVRNLLAYRKVGVEGNTEEFWVPTCNDPQY